MEASKIYGVFPRRKLVDMMIVSRVESQALVGKHEYDKELLRVLDRVHHESGNDLDGLYVLSGKTEVTAYKRERDGFRRVV